jgi:hypothetical protein
LTVNVFCALALATKHLTVQGNFGVTIVVPGAPDRAFFVDYAPTGTAVDLSAQIFSAICGCNGCH